MSDNIDIEQLQCVPCATDGDTERAEEYCIYCNEYICKNCAKDHRKNKMTRNHKLLCLKDVPINVKLFQELKELMSCSDHPCSKVAYRCDTHDTFICVKCVAIKHRTCDVCEVSATSTRDYNVDNMVKQLAELRKKVVTFRHDCETSVKRTLQTLKECKYNNETFVSSMIDKIRKMNETIVAETRQLVEHEISSLQNDITKSEEIQKLGRNQEELAKTVEKYGDKEEQCMAIHCFSRQTSSNDSSLKAMMDRKEIRLTFKRNSQLEGIALIGYVLRTYNDIPVAVKVSTNPMANTSDCATSAMGMKTDLSGRPHLQTAITASVEKIFTKHPIQSNLISASVVIPGKYVAIIDKSEQKLKVFGKSFRFAWARDLDAIPIDMCLIDDNAVAIIFKNDKVIKCYRVDGCIDDEGEHRTRLHCYRIAAYTAKEQALILMTDRVSGRATVEIQIRELFGPHKGLIIRTIQPTDEQKIGGLDIKRIHCNSSGLLIIKQDKINCYSVTENGLEELWFKKYLRTEDLVDLDTGKTGIIYVCGSIGNEIVQIHTRDKHVLEVRTSPFDVQNIRSISVDNKRDIIIACANDGHMHVCKISRLCFHVTG